MAKRRPPPPQDDPPPSGDDDRIRFPFGETADGSEPWDESSGSRSGPDAGEYDDLSGDEDLLEDSDLDGLESASGLDPFGSQASLSSASKLPSMPPDAGPSDDASLDGLEDAGRSEDESLVDLADSADLPATGFSDLGQISDLGSISGPLVIVDEEDEDGASTRFQASIVDDSARLAGAESVRRPKRSRRQSWREEALESDLGEVPTLSGRQGAVAPPAPSRSWAPWVAALVLALAIGGGQELRRRADLAEQAERLAAAQRAALAEAAAQAEREQAAALEAERQRAAADVVRNQQASQRAAEAARAEGRREGEEAARRAVEEAVAQALARGRREGAAAAERAADEAVAARLASARAEAERARAAEVEAARREERERAGREQEAALAAAGRAHADELTKLRDRLREELAGSGATREEEEELAAAIERDKKEALGAKRGGGAAVEDWEAELFGDASSGGSSGAKGGGSGSAGKAAEVDELEGLFADGAQDSGGDGGADEDPDGEGYVHPVDRIWAWARENLHGKVGYKNLSHFSTGPRHDARKTRHELRAELSYRGWLWQNELGSSGLRLVTELEVKVDDDKYATGVPDSLDDEDRRRPILTTKDFYIALAIDWFEVRAGYQLFSWGTGDLYNPTNNLNPIDFSDPFDSRRIPVFAAAITLDLDKVAFELVSIPTFTRSRLPLKNRRFDALRESPLPVLNPEDPEQEAQNAQWAGRVLGHFGGIDVSLSGFSGFDDLPTPRLVVIQQPVQALVVDPVYEKLHVVGADFATTLGVFGAEGRLGEILGGIQLHGEAAHFFSEGSTRDDVLQYVVGVNYQFVDLIFEHDLTLVLEYASEYVTRKAEEPLATGGGTLDRVFRSAVLARLAYDVSENLSFELNGAVILHGPENGYLHPAAKWNVTDNVQLEVSGDVFFGNEGTFFGQFKRDGRLILEARIVF